MSLNGQDANNSLLREEEVKTLKSRRRLYTGVFIIVLAILLYLAGQVLNILASPIAIIVWTTIIVFCLKGPVNNLEKKRIIARLGYLYFLSSIGCSAGVAVLASLFSLSWFRGSVRFSDRDNSWPNK